MQDIQAVHDRSSKSYSLDIVKLIGSQREMKMGSSV